MKKNFLTRVLLASACACGVVISAQADVVTMPAADHAASVPSSLPRKGESMQAVAKKFGEPRVKHPAVGGDAPKHPPITRWDYDGFSVFFENSHVVDAVVPGQPPAVDHSSELHPAQQ
jgi:hypothetical protein